MFVLLEHCFNKPNRETMFFVLETFRNMRAAKGSKQGSFLLVACLDTYDDFEYSVKIQMFGMFIRYIAIVPI